MKGMWKKLLAMISAAVLLMTCPGISVYGEVLNAKTQAEQDSDESLIVPQAETNPAERDHTTEELQQFDTPEAYDTEEHNITGRNAESEAENATAEATDTPEPTADEDLNNEAGAAENTDIENAGTEITDTENANPKNTSAENTATEITNTENAASPAETPGTELPLVTEETGEAAVGTPFNLLTNYKLSNNVTANCYGQYGLDQPIRPALVLTFEKNGTLPTDWKEKLDNAEWTFDDDWRGHIYSIEMEVKSGTGYLPADSSRLFSGIYSAEYIDLTGIDTSKVTTMASMFFNCESLETVTFGNVNTSKVTDMKGMFSRCYSLESADFENLDTANVTDMSSMFFKCGCLEKLDLNAFDTSKVTRMVSMFYECSNLEELIITNWITANVTDMTYMFARCSSLIYLYAGLSDTSKVTSMANMFQMCEKMKDFPILYLDTSNVKDFSGMFSYCTSAVDLYVQNFDTSSATSMYGMFNYCSNVEKLDLSSFDMSGIEDTDMLNDGFLTGCSALVELRTPKANICNTGLPKTMYDANGKSYTKLPKLTGSILLRSKKFKDISKASIAGISLSYGYTGVFIEPAFTVTLDGVVLKPYVDYTYIFYDNISPGTAHLDVEGIGNYGGIRHKTFEIVSCVSSLVDGKTYQLIPKNNSKTAVCAFSGKMVNNTKVYITDRSASEAMRFIAKKNSDGSWKFINAKCELALAIQQNSKEVGKGVVLYEQTTKPMQNWKIERKSDNSFAIKSAVTGLSIAMSDTSAVKGTTLSMQTSASSGLQRFYFASADPVENPYRGLYSIRASKDKAFAVNINGASVKEGANVNLYKYANASHQQFVALYSGGGYYRFINVRSGLVVTATSASAEANVVQMKWAGTNAQRWRFEKRSDGTYRLINAGGYALQLSGNLTQNGSNIMARKPSTTGAQKWYMQKIS